MAKAKRETYGKKLGARIRDARQARGLSQRALAQAVGMRAPKLNELERGHNPDGPKPETIARLAATLGLAADDILPSPL